METYREMRKLEPHVKVLLISGFSQDERANEIINEGAIGFIRKPFQIYELSETIRKALTNA